ncbi:transducin/WD40 repeat-like superfamily protein [Striga asiatica]|uniref:Transducin/WD40 repeat-like superfamily protein n=1 Tax=Striga asiatica TaxID=4170 RepID=A0A5A7P0X5_STRAF|nr:transducin/WD40 repeat-like superfamily protein [Striga asiatica]
MSVFVKKFVEKAFLKKHAGFSDSLEPDDVSPRLVFHYGIPSGSMLLAFDSIQQILAISTKDGQIKLFGKDGSQALLESPETSPSKFLLFIENQGILLHVNINNNIEVWDLDNKCLSGVHHFEKEITSFTAMRNGVYLYVGDSTGDVTVLRLHQEPCQIEKMNYRIPLSASHGKLNEVGSDVMAKFGLIIYSDGAITLWGIQESKVLSTNSNGTTLQSTYQEAKKVTAACWACPLGTKAAVGYSNGDIILWGLSSPLDSKTEQAFQKELCPGQITPIYKLNLGYKADKIPIAKLKWVPADGKSSRLYVLGLSEGHSANLLQVVLLNENTESRTIKLGLHLPESLIDMEITKGPIEQNKNRCDFLLLIGRSSHAYTYDDSLIERYLVQCQTKSSSPSLPKEVKIKLPYCDSGAITVAKFITSLPCVPGSVAEDFNILAKNALPFLPFEKGAKDGWNSNPTAFSAFSNARNLFITGHSSGTINFWDASCPLLLPVASITQQSDNDLSLSGVPLTALQFSYESHLLVSGDQSGMVRVYALKSESFAPQSTFVSFPGSSKKGSNHIIRKIKAVKVNGAVLCITASDDMKQLAVGSDQGYVSLIDLEGPSILYQKHIVSEFCTGIITTHFETCSLHGFEKNVIIVASKDSSFVTLERDTGNTLSSGVVRPNKPSKALFTRILDNAETNNTGVDNSTPKQSFVLLCSEKAVYAYSLLQLVQGVKKVIYKKKFTSSCHWASTFGSPDIGLILLFDSGKIEIRSLPELSLVKESSIRAITSSTLRQSSISDFIVSSSPAGDLIIVNGNQELLFVSTLLHKEAYRHVDCVTKVLDKDLVKNSEVLLSLSPVKEKKKGIFSALVKDNKGPKATNGLEMETTKASRESIEELLSIYSAVNFPTNTETEEKKIVKDDEDVDLDIGSHFLHEILSFANDIDIEDPEEKPRGNSVMAGFNRYNITNKFQAMKGKLKKVKNDKVPEVDEPQDEKTGDIDQIKKKYGYASTGVSYISCILAVMRVNLHNL